MCVTHGASDPVQLYKGEPGTSLKPGNPPASADRILKQSLLCTPDQLARAAQDLLRSFSSPLPAQRRVPRAIPAAPLADQRPSEFTPFCSKRTWDAVVGLHSETSFTCSKKVHLKEDANTSTQWSREGCTVMQHWSWVILRPKPTLQ